MNKRGNKRKHTALVEKLVDQLVQNFYANIKADLAGWDNPEKIIYSETEEKHIAIVTARKLAQTLSSRLIPKIRLIFNTPRANRNFLMHTCKQHNKTFVVVVPVGKCWTCSVKIR